MSKSYQIEMLQLINWLLHTNNNWELENQLHNVVKNINEIDKIYKQQIDINFIKDCINGKYKIIKND